MTTTALETTTPVSLLPSDDELGRYWRLAEMFHQSGVYSDVKMAQQAVAKMIIGRELGLGVATSMQGIQFVKGGIQFHYSTLASFIRSRGYSWRTLERSNERACVMIIDPDGHDVEEVAFTMEDAERAGLTNPSANGSPSMYTKYPRNMLWARMMGDVARFTVPEALGGMPVYVKDADVIEGSAAELSEGEGDGDMNVRLPDEVEAVIARAEHLGHAGFAFRPTWQMKMGMKGADLTAELAAATAALDAMEAELESQPESTSDQAPQPISDANLDESLGGGPPPEDAAPVPSGPAEGSATTAPAVQEPPKKVAKVKAAKPPEPAEVPQETAKAPEAEEVNVEALRTRLGQLQQREPERSDEAAYELWEDEVTYIEAQLSRAAEQASDDAAAQEAMF